MLRVTQPNQPQLFAEVIETVVTRDHVNDAGTFIRPTPGQGWRVLDADRERPRNGGAPRRRAPSKKASAC